MNNVLRTDVAVPFIDIGTLFGPHPRERDLTDRAIMAAAATIARGLSLGEHFFDSAFDRGLSTLRLLRYPIRTLLTKLHKEIAFG